MSPDLERMESLKAGAIAAAIAAIVHTTALLLRVDPFENLWQFGVSEAIAIVEGGLFGVTYRYVLRQDNNPQLKAGAVFAFALVRGLTQVEPAIINLSIGFVQIVFLVESLTMFATAQLALNWAIDRHWVKPFNPTSL